VRSDLELLKIISAFGIVWFHSGYDFGRDVAYAGLIVFLVLSAYFASKSTKDHSIRERVTRLLIPCALWSVLYASLDLVRGQAIFPSDYSVFSKILSTPSIHLWYLPFVFLWVVIIDRIKSLNPRAVAIAAATMASVLLVSAPIWRQWAYSSPLGQYMHATPAVLIGIFLALYTHLSVVQKHSVLGLVILSTAVSLILNISGVSSTYALGVCATLILLKDQDILPKSSVIIGLSKLTFGIFLLHPLILFVLRHIGISSLLLPIMTFFISALCIYVMFKITPKYISQYIA
jgi:hypothetical protein